MLNNSPTIVISATNDATSYLTNLNLPPVEISGSRMKLSEFVHGFDEHGIPNIRAARRRMPEWNATRDRLENITAQLRDALSRIA